MTRKKWINNIATDEAIKIYKIFKLAYTKYETKSDKKSEQPVNSQVLRTFVRTFLRRNHLNQKQVRIGERARAAGMDSGVLDFNVR